MNVFAVINNIAKIDTHTKLERAVRELLLHRYGAGHGLQDGRELGQEAIARQLDDAARMFGNGGVDVPSARATMPGEDSDGAIRILLDQPRIACDIGDQDRRKTLVIDRLESSRNVRHCTMSRQEFVRLSGVPHTRVYARGNVRASYGRTENLRKDIGQVETSVPSPSAPNAVRRSTRRPPKPDQRCTACVPVPSGSATNCFLNFSSGHSRSRVGFQRCYSVPRLESAIIGAGILVCVRILTPFARRASAVGIVMVFVWLGHGISAYQGGFLFDLSGEYTLTYARTALAGIINLMIVGSLYVTITRRRSARAFADAWGTSALAASPIKRARRPSPP